MRVPQPGNGRGSLKWIQRLTTRDTRPLLEVLSDVEQVRRGRLTWLSPLESDDWAEYRDRCFLDRIGHSELAPALRKFWPSRGPQWDALARFEDGTVLLVEAKANVPELASRCAASKESRARIEQTLARAAEAFGLRVTPAWMDEYYQYANRLAHLAFLKEQGVSVLMLFIYFVGDNDVRGPGSRSEWARPLDSMKTSLGIQSSPSAVLEAFLDCSTLTGEEAR